MFIHVLYHGYLLTEKGIIECKNCYGFSEMFLLTDVRHAKNKPHADENKILNISPTFDFFFECEQNNHL